MTIPQQAREIWDSLRGPPSASMFHSKEDFEKNRIGKIADGLNKAVEREKKELDDLVTSLKGDVYQAVKIIGELREEIKEKDAEIKRLNEKIEFLARTNMLYSDWEHRETQVTSDLIRKGIEEHKINAELRAEIERLKQRTWVGLTDDEIEGAIDDGFAFGLDDGNVSNEYVIRYARAIEQTLKEKNT